MCGYDALLVSARQLLLHGKVESAVLVYTEIICCSKLLSIGCLLEAKNNLGVCFLLLSRQNEALDLLNSSIMCRLRTDEKDVETTHPYFYEPIYNKAIAFVHIGYEANALKAFRICLGSSKFVASSLAGIIYCLSAQGNFCAAEHEIDSFNQMYPGNEMTLLLRAHVKYKRGELQSALMILDRLPSEIEDSNYNENLVPLRRLHVQIFLALLLWKSGMRSVVIDEFALAITELEKAKSLLLGIYGSITVTTNENSNDLLSRMLSEERILSSVWSLCFSLVVIKLLHSCDADVAAEANFLNTSLSRIKWSLRSVESWIGYGTSAIALAAPILEVLYSNGQVSEALLRSMKYLLRQSVCSKSVNIYHIVDFTTRSDISELALVLLSICEVVWAHISESLGTSLCPTTETDLELCYKTGSMDISCYSDIKSQHITFDQPICNSNFSELLNLPFGKRKEAAEKIIESARNIKFCLVRQIRNAMVLEAEMDDSLLTVILPQATPFRLII